MVRMKLQQLMTSDAPVGQAHTDLEIGGLCVDSRKVRPGDLFAAIPGGKVDGIRFISDALAKGAVAVLVADDAAVNVPHEVAVIRSPEPRRLLSQISARFFEAQPKTIVAVTGTNGKTSVADFVRQIWQHLGANAASLGTIGLTRPSGAVLETLTTPEPITLHCMLAELAAEGVDHLVLEASSHGLQQYRLHGVRLTAAAFTNISRDHLDYHKSFDDYLAQKLKLFTEVASPGATAVINADGPEAEDILKIAIARGLHPITVGEAGEDLRLVDVISDGFGQKIAVRLQDESELSIRLPLVGVFQVSNALVAAGLVMASGWDARDVLPLLQKLEGAKGRLEHVGTTASSAPIFVDYAHTPDALANALAALKPYARHELVVVFGCGGDRDRGKRPQMGAVAANAADRVIVTDDNPRSEESAAIRAEILAACPGAQEIGDRGQAIRVAIAELSEGDVLLVAGKGHEAGQIVGDRIIPFTDHAAVAAALDGRSGND